MNKKKNAFTLIELLAVIVILAIIALIAVPIILNIIDKANKSAFKDTTYGIISAGELYWAERQLDVNGMQEEEKTFQLPADQNTLGLKGNVPTGTMIITRDGKISLMVKNERYCVTKGLEEDDITITEDPDNCTVPSGGSGNQGTGGSTEKTLTDLAVGNFKVKLVNGTNEKTVSIPECLTNGTECAAGTPIAVRVNETETYKFYVISEIDGEVTLIMDRNLYKYGNITGINTEWINSTDYVNEKNKTGKQNSCTDKSCNDEGPLTVLNTLVDRTSGWTYIPERTYTVKGLAEDGKTEIYKDINLTGRARLLTYGEATHRSTGCEKLLRLSCKDWMFENVSGYGDNNVDGYWLLTADSANPTQAWNVDYNGGVYSRSVYDAYRGVRPVITLKK